MPHPVHGSKTMDAIYLGLLALSYAAIAGLLAGVARLGGRP